MIRSQRLERYALQVFEGLYEQLQDCKSCSQEQSCVCNTVPPRLEYAATFVPPPASPGYGNHLDGLNCQLALVLCNALVKQKHSHAALVAAAEAFYGLISQRLFYLLQRATDDSNDSSADAADVAAMAAMTAALREQGIDFVTDLSSGTPIRPSNTGQPKAVDLAATALQQMQASAVMQQCVGAQVQPLFKQWRKVVKRMHAVLQKLPPGTSTFSPANALTLQQWLAEGPTSSSELSTTISNSHILLLWMAAVLRVCAGLALHAPCTPEGVTASLFSVPQAQYGIHILPSVARMLLQTAVMTHRLQAAGVNVGVHVPPAAAAAALEYVSLVVGELGRTCRQAAAAMQTSFASGAEPAQVTVPSNSPAAVILSEPGEVAFVCNAIIAAYGSMVFREQQKQQQQQQQQQQQDGGATCTTAGTTSSSSSSVGTGGDASGSSSPPSPPSGSGSLAQGLLLRRADRLQAKPDSWDQEFASTHSRCWQQLYQQHWTDLGFPPSLLHPVIDSLCALNRSAAGVSSSFALPPRGGGGSRPISTASALQAVSAAVEVLLSMVCSHTPFTERGSVMMHSRIVPVGALKLSQLSVPGSSLCNTSPAILMGKLALWLLPLVSMQLHQAAGAKPPAATLTHVDHMFERVLQSISADSYLWVMWQHVYTNNSVSAALPQERQQQLQERHAQLELSLGVRTDIFTQQLLLLTGQVSVVLQQLLWLSAAASASGSAAVDQPLRQSHTSRDPVAPDVTGDTQASNPYWQLLHSCCSVAGESMLCMGGLISDAGSSYLQARQHSRCELLAATVQAAEAALRHVAAMKQQQQQQKQGWADDLFSSTGDIPGVALHFLTLADTASKNASSTVCMSPQQQQLLLAAVSLMLSCIKCRSVLPASCEGAPVSPAHVYVVLLLALHDARAAATNTASTTTVLPPLLHAALTLVGRWSVCMGQQLQQDRGSAAKWLSSVKSLGYFVGTSLQPHLPPDWKRKRQEGEEGAEVTTKATCGEIVQQLLLLFDQVVQDLPVLIQRQQQPGSGDDGVGSSSSSNSSSSPLAASVLELLRTCTLQQLRGQHPSATVPPLAGSTSAAAAASPPAVEELPAWLCLFGRQLCAALPSPFGCCNPSCANLATVSEGFALVRGNASVCGGCGGGGGGGSVSGSGRVEGGTSTTTAMAARYCSVACQAAHWPQHKATCALLRQAQQQEHQQQHTEQTRSWQATRRLRVLQVVEEEDSEEEEGAANEEDHTETAAADGLDRVVKEKLAGAVGEEREPAEAMAAAIAVHEEMEATWLARLTRAGVEAYAKGLARGSSRSA